MKPLFRCEYCDKIGTEAEIIAHEDSCINNYNKRSCMTCLHAENKITRINCKCKKEIPEGKIYEHCGEYVWDQKDHTSRNPIPFNNLFGGAFGI